jgi:AcrR family transcriptional regulator
VQPATRGRGRPPAAQGGGDARQRIVTAARQIFSEVGYDAATYQAIAERTGLTRPAVNHHFRHKRDLYREVVQQTNTALVRAGMEKAAAESTLPAQIEAFIAAAIGAEADEHSGAAFLATSLLEFQRHPELRNENDDSDDLRVFLNSLVVAAIARGELSAETSGAAMADALLAVLWGMGFYAGFIGTHAQLTGVLGQLRQLLGDSRPARPAPPNGADVQLPTSAAGWPATPALPFARPAVASVAAVLPLATNAWSADGDDPFIAH